MVSRGGIMKHTRRQFLQLSAIAAAGVVLAACAPTAVSGTAVPKAGEATAVPATAVPKAGATTPVESQVNPTPAGQFPIVKDKITLTVLLGQTYGVTSYADNEFTKWLEDCLLYTSDAADDLLCVD